VLEDSRDLSTKCLGVGSHRDVKGIKDMTTSIKSLDKRCHVNLKRSSPKDGRVKRGIFSH
jgi:hypothetical protein